MGRVEPVEAVAQSQSLQSPGHIGNKGAVLRLRKKENTSGSLNVPIEHHPTIRYMVYNGYYKVMSNIPKMGQLPTPVVSDGDAIGKQKRSSF